VFPSELLFLPYSYQTSWFEMTPDEYSDILNSMTEEEFANFQRDFGGDKKRYRLVDEFVHNPTHERKICHILGLKTEEEKRTEAAVRSAEAVTTSAQAATRSAEAATKSAEAAASSAKTAAGSRRIAFGAFIATVVLAFAGLVTLLWKLYFEKPSP